MLVKVGNKRRLASELRRDLVVARTGDEYVAFDDRCPHRGGSLAGGALVAGRCNAPGRGVGASDR